MHCASYGAAFQNESEGQQSSSSPLILLTYASGCKTYNPRGSVQINVIVLGCEIVKCSATRSDSLLLSFL